MSQKLANESVYESVQASNGRSLQEDHFTAVRRPGRVEIPKWMLAAAAGAVVVLCIAIGVGVHFGTLNSCSAATCPSTVTPATTTLATTPGSVSPQDLRLPTALRPVMYELSLQPYIPADNLVYDHSKDFTFDGSLSITISCLQATNNITLNINNLVLIDGSISLAAVNATNSLGPNIPLDKSSYPAGYHIDGATQKIVFFLTTALTPQTSYLLSFNYTGTLINDDSLAGFYRSSYTENGQKRWV